MGPAMGAHASVRQKPCVSSSRAGGCQATGAPASIYNSSVYALSLRLRVGWRSLRSAFASIWRMRSRVTLKNAPPSSGVRCAPSSVRPKRSRITLASRGVSVRSTSLTSSRSMAEAAECAGLTTLVSSMKSPRFESSSSPIGRSSEIGSCAALRLLNHTQLLREIEVTSLVEIVLAPHADDLSHPAFHKLFLETEYRPECTALLCGRRPRSPDELTPWAVHVLSAEDGFHGAIEWETDRQRFLGRGRTPEDPLALDGRALSGTTGAVLDPLLSLRRRVRIAPGGQVRLAFATGVATSRAAAIALAEKYDDSASAARTFALATTQTQMRLRHLGISTDEAQLYERLASHGPWTHATLPAPPPCPAGTP